MSLNKTGTQLRIIKTASSIEGLLLDKPVEASLPKTSIVSPVLEDHLFYRARAISAGDFGPMDKNGDRGFFYNGNYDYFPRAELEKACPTFPQKNIFLDHQSSSSLFSVGKILDSYPVEDPETGEFYLEILGRIDRKCHPEICRKIETGELNSTSMGCFKAGTLVLTSKGFSVPIENIKEGESVVTHLGNFRNVTATMDGSYVGNIYNLNISKHNTIPATEEHPFLAIKMPRKCACGCNTDLVASSSGTSVNLHRRFIVGHQMRVANPMKHEVMPEYTYSPTPEFVKASELLPNDILLFPKNGEVNNSISAGKMRLAGYFVAEGCYLKHKGIHSAVQFHLSIDEEDNLAKEIVSLMKSEFNIDAHIYKSKAPKKANSITVQGYNKEVAAWFKKHCGEYSYGKQVSQEILSSHPSQQLNFLAAWLNGDGCVSKYGDGSLNALTGTSVSKVLVDQIQYMAARCGIKTSCQKHKERANRRQAYTVRFSSNQSKQLIKISKWVSLSFVNNPTTSQEIGDYIAYPIKSITIEPYVGQVYNLEVEDDNSYIVNGVAVHNCSVDESICSICSATLHSDADEKCAHLSHPGKQFEAQVDFPEYRIKKGEVIPAFSINKGIQFNEDSIVGVPADPTAQIVQILASNMRKRLSKTAVLSTNEQLDFVKQFENLLSKVDSDMAIKLKAEFCGICPQPIKESVMSDTNLPSDEQKKILAKISALEMEQLTSYVNMKTKKASEVANKEVVADATKKEETFLSKIVAKVKDSFAAQLLEKKVEAVAKEELGKEAREYQPKTGEPCSCREGVERDNCSACEGTGQKIDFKKIREQNKRSSLSAKFNEDKKNVLASTWSVYEGDKLVLDASLKDIWGSQFETFSFADQKWATSEAYGKEAIARYENEGIAKLAWAWDVSHKISKVAFGPMCKCEHGESVHTESNEGCTRCRCRHFDKEASLKEAKGPELGPDGSYAKPSTGLSNKEHNVKNSPVSKPGQEQAQKGPTAPKPAEVKTETKIDMPGQEKGQTGPAASKAKEVKTDYSEPKPEAEGKEVKTTPKNPEEKKLEKSEKEVETSYVAKGTEAMEAEEGKKDKKEEKKASVNYKEANAQIKWSSMTPEAQEFIKKHVEKHIKEDGMERAQAVAAAYSEAREKGMDVPSKKSSQEPIMEKKAAEKPVESVDGSTLPEGKKEMGDKPEESVQGTTLPEEGKAATPETSVDGEKVNKTPNPAVAPVESVEKTTIPNGKKDEESVEETTHPDSKKSVGTEPEKSVQASKSESAKPEEAVADKPELSKKTVGDKAEESAQGNTQPEGTDPKKPIDEAVKKEAEAKFPCEGCGKMLEGDSGDTCAECMKKHLQKNDPAKKEAATEMPIPEDKPAIEEQVKDEVKVEEPKPEALPVEAPVAEAPVSAFDTAEKLDIGEGYSAHKDKETKEVIIEKDGKEVKRLPDGFGADVAIVVPLLKAVLGLPPEANNHQDMPDLTKPMGEEAPKEEVPHVEENPALQEAHEDELGIKESALKVKEAELIAKEAAIKAQEETLKKEAAAKHFAEVLKVRSERCKKLIASMVEKGAIEMDKATYDEERANGTYLLDAQHKAFEAALTNKHKELIAMSDDSLLAMEKVVADLKAPVVKKASHIFASPAFTAEMSDDETLQRIFNTMGKPDQHPQ